MVRLVKSHPPQLYMAWVQSWVWSFWPRSTFTCGNLLFNLISRIHTINKISANIFKLVTFHLDFLFLELWFAWTWDILIIFKGFDFFTQDSQWRPPLSIKAFWALFALFENVRFFKKLLIILFQHISSIYEIIFADGFYVAKTLRLVKKFWGVVAVRWVYWRTFFLL